MTHHIRNAVWIAVLVGVLAAAAFGAFAQPGRQMVLDDPPQPAPVARLGEPLTVATPEYRELIEWGTRLYIDAGLDLSGVSVGVYDDAETCNGHRGIYGEGIVKVCALHRNPEVQQAWRRHTLLHELGHAWTDRHLDEPTMLAFGALRSTAPWGIVDVDWGQQTREHAAEVIAWAVADYPLSPHQWLADRSCQSLELGYEQLTGRPAALGNGVRCE